MNIETAFGIVLRRLRNEKSLSQEELADISGFHRTYLSLLERGRKTPSLVTIEKLAQALGIPMHQFVFLVEEELMNSNELLYGEHQ
jgi:transcriptional regulator with XRE-family HTH domain